MKMTFKYRLLWIGFLFITIFLQFEGTTAENKQSKKHTIRRCRPRDRWESGCAICQCSVKGVVNCDRSKCPQISEDNSQDSRACSPGDEWLDECNICICNNEGLPICTKIACNKRSGKRVDWSWHEALASWQYSSSSPSVSNLHHLDCDPFQLFHMGCNSCVCNTKGVLLCTQRICSNVDDKLGGFEGVEEHEIEDPKPLIKPRVFPPPLTPKETEVMPKEGDICYPGSSWLIDCIQCHCNGKAEAVCTPVKNCNGIQNEEEDDVEIDHPGWVDRVSTNPDHSTAGSNPPKPEPDTLGCLPGSTWTKRMGDRCKITCTCNERAVAVCTEERCKGGDELVGGEPVAEAGDPVDREPVDGEPVNRGRGTGQNFVKRCKPGIRWKEQCNLCICNERGKPKCTERGCN